MTDILAIDFGTSNSAAALLHEGGVFRIPVEDGAETLPTAVFFPTEGGAMRIGAAAAQALIAREEGRYMRALKSVLGTQLVHEQRLIGGKRRSVAQIISDFLIRIRERAEAVTGQRFRRALSGRPVHFHSAHPARDAKAEADLRGCYLAAGFDEVSFLAEPEAAAIASLGIGAPDELGLIVDIGGGTSDFTVFRNRPGGLQILGSHGIRLGGTDFDHAVSMSHAMPLLGLGGQLKRAMGEGLLPVPRAPFVDLATWAKIPFLYTPETRRLAADMRRNACAPDQLARFASVVEDELGHELAFAVERGKIDANTPAGLGRIDMEFIEARLSASVTGASLAAALDDSGAALSLAMTETLRMAEVAPGQIGRVILVGGSSLMGLVSDRARALCPDAALLCSEAFTAVVDGLALATREGVH